MHRCRAVGVFIFLSLFVGELFPAYAQHWQTVSTPTGSDLYVTPYYLTPNIGFTFVAGISEVGDGNPTITANSSNMARTTNGGISWTMIPFFDNLGISVTQLCFVSLTHGYASTVSLISPGNAGPSGIYETTDQGNTWKKISKANAWFSGVYASGGRLFAAELEQVFGLPYNYRGSQIIYTSDNGKTWDSLQQAGSLQFPSADGAGFQWIYGNRDSLVATVYLDAENNLYLVYSTDLGESWNSSFLDPDYDWNMIALHLIPHSCRIIREFLDRKDVSLDTYSLVESDPPYSIWNLSIQHLETGAWVAGNPCAMYLSYAGPDFIGPVQRSTDNGISWTSVGTTHTSGSTPDMVEIDDKDWQNMSVVGYGAVVYAIGTQVTGMWETTDGGDGSLSAASLAPHISFERAPFFSTNDTLFSGLCQLSAIPISFQNLSCAVTKLTSFSVAGLTSTEYSASATNHNDCLSLPDTIYLTISPTQPGIRTVTVSAQFTDDEFQTLDTSLSFILQVRPGTSISISAFLKPAVITTTAGNAISIPVYLSGTTTLGATTIELPFVLDSNALEPIGFQSLIPGLTVESVSFNHDTDNVLLHSDGISLIGDTLLGYLHCIPFISDSLSTAVSLSTIGLTAANAPCIALSLTSDTVSIHLAGCGSTTMAQFLRMGELSLGIRNITPNPANEHVSISFANASPAIISYQVSDELGIVRLFGTTSGDNLDLDVHSLPSGLYYMRAIDSTTGIATEGRFVVER